MLEQFISMIRQAEMLSSFDRRESTINYNGEDVEVINIVVPVSDAGDAVIVTFHKGTEMLIDMGIKHVCTCGHHH